MIHGYYLVAGNKAYFLKTDTTRKTSKIIYDFIDLIGKHRNLSSDLIERAKQDQFTIDDFRRRLSAATIEKKQLPTITFYTIQGKNFIENFPEDDFKKSVTIF